jgi:hypothetical protein
MQLMLQATVCDCLALDPVAFEEDGLGAPKVDVSRGEIVEALVIARMLVVRPTIRRPRAKSSAGIRRSRTASCLSVLERDVEVLLLDAGYLQHHR